MARTDWSADSRTLFGQALPGFQALFNGELVGVLAVLY